MEKKITRTKSSFYYFSICKTLCITFNKSTAIDFFDELLKINMNNINNNNKYQKNKYLHTL